MTAGQEGAASAGPGADAAGTPDIAIVGGGLAGGAAACLLAAQGRSATLFEREATAHDKVCGEFLSGEAAEYLAALGIEPCALGAAPIHAVRLVHGSRTASAALPFPAWGLSRRILDAALLDRAEAAGADVRRGQAVRAAEGGALLLDGHRTAIRPRAVLLATGKHDLRGARRQPRRPPADHVGIKLHLLLSAAQAAALAGWVEVYLFGPRLEGGYAGLQPIEGGRANLCMLLPGAALPREPGGAGWPMLAEMLGRQAPLLAERLEGSHPVMDRVPAVARVPYGFVHRPVASDRPNLYRLGDQAGVIPSFCGDGMAIALHSAALAARCIAQDASAASYHRRLRRAIKGQIGRATLLGAAAERWPAALLGLAGLLPGGIGLAARLTRVPRRHVGASLPSVDLAAAERPLQAARVAASVEDHLAEAGAT